MGSTTVGQVLPSGKAGRNTDAVLVNSIYCKFLSIKWYRKDTLIIYLASFIFKFNFVSPPLNFVRHFYMYDNDDEQARGSETSADESEICTIILLA